MQLKEYRMRMNLSQQQLADKLEINQKTYSNYENGRAEPNIEKLIKLANLFNVSVDTLIGHNSEMLDLKALTDNQRKVVNDVVYNLNNEQVATIAGFIAGMKK